MMSISVTGVRPSQPAHPYFHPLPNEGGRPVRPSPIQGLLGDHEEEHRPERPALLVRGLQVLHLPAQDSAHAFQLAAQRSHAVPVWPLQ